jgi:hypothetical protein
MRGFFYYASMILVVFGTIGCFNMELDKPLVDLGQDDSHYSAPATPDPAPGVPDSQLTREERLQRNLAQCEQYAKIKEKKYDALKEECESDKKYLKKQIEKLEDKIDDLEEENRKLRKDLREHR